MDSLFSSLEQGLKAVGVEIVGPRPANDASGRLPWRDEYEPLSVAWIEADRAKQGAPQHFSGMPHADLVRFLSSEEGGEYLQLHEVDRPKQLHLEQRKIDLLVAKGWHREDAEAFQLLFPLRSVLSADLDRTASSSQLGVRFPACNYAVAEALFHTAANQRGSTMQAPRRLYKHLAGPNSLTEADSAWAGLKVPDRTGFRGLTSTALCVATDDPRCFVPSGFRNKTTADDEGADIGPREVAYDLVESDVVCFESAANEEELMKACVMIDEQHGALPANTLFRLKRIEEPGTWAVDGMRPLTAAEAEAASPSKPSKNKNRTGRGQAASTGGSAGVLRRETEAGLVAASVRPNCRLFVVSCTFKRPTEAVAAAGGVHMAKLCGSVRTLLYADRETYVKGLDDILEDPVLTMEEEFMRTRPPFTDWRGVQHELRQLWAYASGPACSADCSQDGAGWRDRHNDGMLPDDFLQRVNRHVHERRAEIVSRHRSPGGSAWAGFDPLLMLLSEDDCLLTLDEVIAVRLYSGPAFQPINEFLREIGKLSGEFRIQMARHRELTFAATTRHLCFAVRKLADVTREANSTLFRAVRGELPPAFWDRDSAGMISAVDSGFMSTSKNMRTPVSYMSGHFNVLWELAASEPSDDAYHRGADISMLSQYQHEDEVLFPPNTMLIVRPAAAVAARTRRASTATNRYEMREEERATLSIDEAEEDRGVRWKRVHVRPCFV